MSEWKEGKLIDIAEILMGQSPSGETCNSFGEGLALLNGPTEFGVKNPLAIQYTIDQKKISQPNDILFCVRGSTTGKMNWSDKEYAIGRGLAAIRHKIGYEYKSFLRGVIDYNLPLLLASATGSTFPNISKSQLEDLEISIPPFPEQKSIALILSSLDDKIDLLHRQNATLEKMAETLFRQLMSEQDLVGLQDGQDEVKDKSCPSNNPENRVQDYGEEAKEDWEEVSLKEFISIKHGYAFKGTYITAEQTNLILVTPGNFKIGGGFKFDKFKYYTNENFPKDYIFKAGDLIVTMTDLSVDGNTLGYPAFVPENYSNEVYLHNQRVGKVEFKSEIGKYFLHQLMKTDDYQWFVLGGASGTAIRHTSPTSICNYSFRLPPKSKILEFETIANGLEEKNKKNQIQIPTLTALRDTLLPKLMSGEVRLSEHD